MLTRRGLLGTAVGAVALASSGCGRAAGRPAAEPVGVGFTVVAKPDQEAAYARDLAELQKTGARWIRLGIQAWDLGGWFDGRWYWDEPRTAFFSACIAQARSAGLKVSLTLAAMANADDWTLEQYLVVNRSYWAKCAQLAAAAGGVELVQVYNEHDTKSFRSQQLLGDLPTSAYLSELAEALASARREFRAILPHVLTTTAVGGSPFDDATRRRWSTFFDGVAAAVDVLGINCYPGPVLDQIDKLPTPLTMLQDRYGKRLAITEIGLPTEVGGAVTTDAAVAALPLMVQRAVDSAPLAVLIYQLRNTGYDARDPEQNFGILTADHQHRVTYDAVVEAVGRQGR